MELREKTRLNKYLADCGVCSRREADRLIASGQVRINGRIAGLGELVDGREEIFVGKKKLEGRARKIVLAFHKPVGVTCTEKDPHAEKIIQDIIHYPERVTYAGRLDKDSEGLLLLTNDGDLIQAMMRGANGHEKEYRVTVQKEITPVFLEKMAAGVYLKELDKTTRPCVVKQIGKYSFAIILTQGLNRQIRRMCEACGNSVVKLKRIRVLNVNLGDLKPGQYRELGGEELLQLYSVLEDS